MADNSPNTTMEDFTNSTIDTDDLSLLELQQEVHNLEAENEANSFGSDFSINQDGNQNEDPFDVDIEPIPPNPDDIHEMGGKRKRKRKTRRKTKRKSLKKRRKTKKRNKKNRNTKKRK